MSIYHNEGLDIQEQTKLQQDSLKQISESIQTSSRKANCKNNTAIAVSITTMVIAFLTLLATIRG